MNFSLNLLRGFLFAKMEFKEIFITDFSDLIALKIKELMGEKDMTIYKLETLSGVYSSTIALFLTRKTKTIRLENLLFLCEALGISLSEFFADKRFLEAEPKDYQKK